VINPVKKLWRASKIFRIVTIIFSIIIVPYLLFLSYLMLSPSVALHSCVDNGGIWVKDDKRCLCDNVKEGQTCLEILEEAYGADG